MRTYTKVGVTRYNRRTFTASTEFSSSRSHHCSCRACCAERGYQQYPASERLQQYTTQYAIAQRLFNVTTLDNRVIMIPSWVPQSSSVTTRSCARQPDDESGNRSSQFSVRYPQTFTSTVGGDEVLEYVQTFTKFAVIGVSMMEPSGFAIRPRYQQADESVPQNHAHRSRPSLDAVEGNLLLFLTVTVNHGFVCRLSIIALDTRSFAAAQIS